MGRMTKGGVATIAMLVAACTSEPAPQNTAPDAPITTAPQPVPEPGPVPNPRPGDIVNPPPPPAALIGETLVEAEWRSAANRASCAPLALRSAGGIKGTPRPATFSGGWAIAFDQPDRRSAFGVAGTGLTPADRADFAVKVDRLARQWPLIRRWDARANLPAGSAAGYGLEGAVAYPTADQASGRQSLAYLRIPGQACLYNVWSKLGRDHLELLLGELEMVRP